MPQADKTETRRENEPFVFYASSLAIFAAELFRLGFAYERFDGTTIERAAGLWPVLTAWGFFIAEVWEAKHGAKNWIGVTKLISLVDQQEWG